MTLVVAVLLLAVLALVPFHTTGGGLPTHGGQTGRTAVQSPAAAVGLLAALLVAGTVAWVALATLLPHPTVPAPGRALLPLAAATLVLIVVKLLLDLHDLGPGAWLSVAVGAGLVAGNAGALPRPSARKRRLA